ncbi:MAG: DUF11 domain-containing protein, partial [Acidimicrobiales bacterium]|nr:DUF11 domain-containing protein [Acidimicrobiales bacterium]
VVLEIVVVVDEAGEHTTVAQVTGADQPDVDSTPANDLPDEDDQDQVSIIGELADLSLTKAVSDDAPALGSQVTYTLTLANAGPSDATGVAVIDRLPDSLTYVSHQGPGAYDPTTGRWEVGDLATDAQAILLITVQVDGLGTTTNQAWVGESDQPDPDSTPDPDDPGPEGEDDHDQVDVTPVPATLRGVIWLDEDGDGTFDDDESPIPGVTIDLLDVDGELVATTTTDTEGGYVFTDLLPGTYTVVVDQSTLPATIDGQTYDPDDVSDSRFTVTVEAGQNVVDVDFGYEPVQAPEPPPTPEPVPEPPAPVDRALPVTGSDALRLAGIGLALLAAGALVLFGRRRGTWAGLRR